MDIAELGLRVRSDTVKNAQSDLRGLTVEAGKAEVSATKLAKSSGSAALGVKKAGDAAQIAGRRAARSSQGFRNMGLQLNQVAQQGAVTGDYMRALAIQLPDLLLGFGSIGIAIGIAAGALTPFITGLLKTEDGAKALADQMDDLNGLVETAAKTADTAATSLFELREAYGDAAVGVRELYEAQRDLAVFDASEALSGAVESLTARFGDLGAVSAEAFDQIANKTDFIRTKYAELQAAQASGDTARLAALQAEVIALGRLPNVVTDVAIAYEITTAEAQNLLVAVREFQTAGTFDEQATAARTLANEILKASGGVAEMDDETRSLYQSLLQAENNAVRLGAVDVSSNIGAGANEAGRLAGNLSDALATFNRLSAQQAQEYSGRGGDPRDFEGGPDYQNEAGYTSIDSQIDTFNRRAGAGGRGRSGGGGGGGGRDEYADQLESLRESLRTEREITDEWYAEGQELLANRRAQEILGEEEHRNQKLRLEEEYQQRLSEIQGGGRDQQLAEASTFFGELANVTAQGGERLTKVTRTFGAVEALINTYRAAAQTLADPSLGFFGKMAAYTSVLGAGLGLVNAIRGGGSAGGGASGASASSAAAAQEQQEPQRIILQGLDPSALFTGEMIQNIFDGIFDENRRRGGVIVVNT